MHHLNYCRQMTKQFSSAMTPNCEPHRREVLSHMVDLAAASQKFLLPFGGRIFDDNEYRALDETIPLRLPFPFIALEYARPNEAPEGSMQSSKAILFARERDDGIVVAPVSWIDHAGLWGPLPEAWIPSVGYLDRTTRMGGIVATRIKLADERVGIENYADEVGALLQFLNALQCANVTLERSAVGKVKKAMRKALPFDDYHILKIQGRAGEGAAHGSADSRTPREHLRRGHIRCYENGLKIWVNATVVNAGVGGVVTKDYRLNGA